VTAVEQVCPHTRDRRDALVSPDEPAVFELDRLHDLGLVRRRGVDRTGEPFRHPVQCDLPRNTCPGGEPVGRPGTRPTSPSSTSRSARRALPRTCRRPRRSETRSEHARADHDHARQACSHTRHIDVTPRTPGLPTVSSSSVEQSAHQGELVNYLMEPMLRPLARWAELSQRQACRNAMVASTALASNRRERNEVQEFVEEVLAHRQPRAGGAPASLPEAILPETNLPAARLG